MPSKGGLPSLGELSQRPVPSLTPAEQEAFAKARQKLIDEKHLSPSAPELPAFEVSGQSGNSILKGITKEQQAKFRKALLEKNPNPFPPDVDFQAHHIFPVELFDTPLGLRLQELGINLNGTENGILLPTKRFDGWRGAIHSGGPPESYATKIKAAFTDVTTKEEGLNALRSVREKLWNGELQIN